MAAQDDHGAMPGKRVLAPDHHPQRPDDRPAGDGSVPVDLFDARRKRARIRAWRRGIKEMDLILGGHADAELATMDDDELALFEAVLGENDHDLFSWVTGQTEAPERFAPLMRRLARRTGNGAD